MAAMKSMRRTKTEREASDKAMGMPGAGSGRPAPALPPDEDDVKVRLEPHHVAKLFGDMPPAHGTKISFAGDGHVTYVGSHNDMSGQPQHNITISLHRASADADQMPVEKGAELRSQIKDNMGKSEAKAADREAAKATARGAAGAKAPEKVDG